MVIDILITNFVSKSYDFSTYGESIVKPTIIGIITIGLSTLFWLTQSDPTLQPSLSVNNPISSMANFTGTANFTNPNHLLKSFERSFADFLPLLPMGSEIKVGIIDYIIKIVGGAVVAFVISAIIVVLLTPHSLTNTLAQSPQSSIKDQNIKSLDVKDAAYNANTSKFLGSKNITLTPNRITEIRFTENGFLNGVGNVTNNKTFTNTYLSDDLLVGRGKGAFETPDGQSINWISSDMGRSIGNQWVFYGIMLFNSTQSGSLSLLNNSIGVYRSTSDLNEPEYIWLLE